MLSISLFIVINGYYLFDVRIDIESVNASNFMSEVFERVLDVAYPSSDLLQAAFNSMFVLCAKIGPAHFVDLVCKVFILYLFILFITIVIIFVNEKNNRSS